MFFYTEFLDRAIAAGLREITFSIHGHTARLHDAQTRAPGSFAQAIVGLRNALARRGLIVSADVVVNRMNVSQLKDILLFLIGLGVREFDLLHFSPFGDAWRNRRRIFYDAAAHLPQLRQALALSRRPDITLWTNRLPARYLDGFESLIQPPEKLHDEVTGRRADLRDWWQEAKPLPCRGARCRYCFLEDFCRDLASLCRDGRVPAKELPACLPRTSLRRPPTFIKTQEADLDGFVRFYTRYRYFHKGGTCVRCARRSGCAGVPIAHLRRAGPPKPLQAAHG
jgi:MoaA/NifB/PqqE/SkfB family radical SAM enzyme